MSLCSVWDVGFWSAPELGVEQDLWSLREPACCSYSLTLPFLLSPPLSQGIKVKTGIKWSVKHSRLSSLCLFFYLSHPLFLDLFSTFLANLYVYPTAFAAGDQIRVKEGWETEIDFEVRCLYGILHSPTKENSLQHFKLLHNFWLTYILSSRSKYLSCRVISVNTAGYVSWIWTGKKKRHLPNLSASIMSLILI